MPKQSWLPTRLLRASAVGLLLLISKTSLCGWSEEIRLWNNSPDEPWLYEASMAVDGRGRVHIVFSHRYRETNGSIWLQYLQLDSDGLPNGPLILLNDTTSVTAAAPKIRFFGEDSLWIMWYAARYESDWVSGFDTRTLDLDGNVLGQGRVFQDSVSFGLNYAFAVREDRAVVFASSYFDTLICLIVQLPDGSRPIDRAPIFQRRRCDHVDGFLDANDSLQIVWRQQSEGWQASLAKRVDTHVPLDPDRVHEYVALTPEAPGAFSAGAEIIRIGDSLMAMEAGGIPLPGRMCTVYLHLFRYSHYQVVTPAVVLGDCPAEQPLGIEGDSAISTFCFPDDNLNLHYCRFRLPDLVLQEDTMLIYQPGGGAADLHAYTVTPDGRRHVVYTRGNGDSSFLCYRFWQPELDAPMPQRNSAYYPSIELIPNPCAGVLTLYSQERITGVFELFNLLGQRVYRIPLESTSLVGVAQRITLDPLPAGIYFGKIVLPNQVLVQKLCIVR